MKHPKLITKLVNLTGALIAFNREIGSVAADFQSGFLVSNPQGSLQNLMLNSIGLRGDGSIDQGRLYGSIVSKVGGYGFVKVAKFFLKHFRI